MDPHSHLPMKSRGHCPRNLQMAPSWGHSTRVSSQVRWPHSPLPFEWRRSPFPSRSGHSLSPTVPVTHHPDSPHGHTGTNPQGRRNNEPPSAYLHAASCPHPEEANEEGRMQAAELGGWPSPDPCLSCLSLPPAGMGTCALGTLNALTWILPWTPVLSI